MTISQQAGDVRGRAVQGPIGGLVNSSILMLSTTAINSDPQAVQIDTVTNTAANDAVYTITVDGTSVVFTADGSATTDEITDGLIALIELSPLIRGKVAPVKTSATVITLTGLSPGLAITITSGTTGGGTLVTANTQAAAAAAAVPFGRLVVDDGLSDSVDQLGKLAASTGFTAQVHTANLIFVTNATYLVTIRDEAGAVIAQGETDAITNTATTTAAIATTMNGLLPANSVLVAGGATFVTFTAELAGREFSVEVGTNEEGQAGSALVSQVDTTGPDPATSVNQAALGLTRFSLNDPTPTIGGTAGEYAANAGMRVLQSGNSMWVERPGAVSKGDPVFVELDGTGSDAGKLFTADSATRVRLLGATWERDARNTSDGIAAVAAAF